MILCYSTLGTAIPDYQAKPFVFREFQRHPGNQKVIVSSSLVIRAAQRLIAEGKIPADEIKFEWNGSPIQHDEFGRFTETPEGYADPYSMSQKNFAELCRGRMFEALNGEQRQEFNRLYTDWFNANLFEVIDCKDPQGYNSQELGKIESVSWQEDDEQEVGSDSNVTFDKELGVVRYKGNRVDNPTPLYFVPDAAGKASVDVSTVRAKYAVGWVVGPNGSPALVFEDQTAAAVGALVYALFDKHGDRMVPRTFNGDRALHQVLGDNASVGFEV